MTLPRGTFRTFIATEFFRSHGAHDRFPSRAELPTLPSTIVEVTWASLIPSLFGFDDTPISFFLVL